MKINEKDRTINIRNWGDHRIMHYRVIRAIPQAPGAIAIAYAQEGSLRVDRAMPLSVNTALPRPGKPSEHHRKNAIH